MEIYLNNLREVAKGIHHLRKLLGGTPRSIDALIAVTGYVMGNLALIKDFTGKDPLPHIVLRKYGCVCTDGGVAEYIAIKYVGCTFDLLSSIDKRPIDKCPLCKEVFERFKRVAVEAVSEERGAFVFSSGKGKADAVLVPVMCLFCSSSIASLLIGWIRTLMEPEFSLCTSPMCVFSEKFWGKELAPFCSQIMEIQQVKELKELFTSCCLGGKEPPKYIRVDEIVRGIIKSNILCEEHINALKKKLSIKI